MVNTAKAGRYTLSQKVDEGLLERGFSMDSAISFRDACEIMGLPISTGETWHCRGRFPVRVVKINKRNMIMKSDLEGYFDRIKREADARSMSRGDDKSPLHVHV